MPDIFRFAEFMKGLRTKSNLSVDEAARKIGVGVRELEEWEGGKQLPSELSAERISQVYGISKTQWLEALRHELGRLRRHQE